MILLLPITVLFVCSLLLQRVAPLSDLHGQISVDLNCLRRNQPIPALNGSESELNRPYRLGLCERTGAGVSCVTELNYLRGLLSQGILRLKKCRAIEGQILTKGVIALILGIGLSLIHI